MKQRTHNILWAVGSAAFLVTVMAVTAPREVTELLSDSVTQPPRYEVQCWECEDGITHCTVPCDTDMDCAIKNGGDGGPAPHWVDHPWTRGDSVTR